MKKLLIITYYWPPSGGSGVQRWLKFAKYLPDYGWESVVFTPENPSFEVKDESLVRDIDESTEVIKFPIWEPYHLFNKFKGNKKQQSDLVKRGKKGMLTKCILWLRGNFLMPDPRVFWVKPASRFLQDLIKDNGIDAIVTTGPPHSMHLIGLKLKKNTGIPWLVDFRDPWSQWELFDQFYLTKYARARHRKLEKKVLQKADQVITVSNHYAKNLAILGQRSVEVVTNGFDAQEFSGVNQSIIPKRFVIGHVGVVDELRDPTPLLEAARQWWEQRAEKPDFIIEFTGNVNEVLRARIASDTILSEMVVFKPYVPHAQVFDVYRSAAVLLLVLADSINAQGNIPGKLFEYLAARRPVLAIGATEGDSAAIIEKTGAGITIERGDKQGMIEGLENLYVTYKAGKFTTNGDNSPYTRQRLTGKLAQHLNDMTNG